MAAVEVSVAAQVHDGLSVAVATASMSEPQEVPEFMHHELLLRGRRITVRIVGVVGRATRG